MKAKDNSTVGLMGFTTVSTSKQFALQYALNEIPNNKSNETPRHFSKPKKSGGTSAQSAETEPVVFRIVLNNVYDRFEMNTLDYNAYTDNQNEEILL